MPKYSDPEGLGVQGQKLWDSIANSEKNYELKADELRTLEEACRLLDVIERMHEHSLTAPVMVDGMRPGTEMLNPVFQELRMSRKTLSDMLKSLKLPDSPAGALQKADYLSEQRRAAARARYASKEA